MSQQVLIVRDDLNRVSFDSTVATAGVCLGIYHVPLEGATFNFTDYIDQQGFTINISGNGRFSTGYAGNRNNGWLQFAFPSGVGPFDVALFAR
jgi:hypothetical protein